MKKAYLAGVFGLCLLLTSCLDMTEYIKLRADGSGEYAIEMDMARSMELFNQYTAMSELAGQSLGPNKFSYMDTVVSLKQEVDTLRGITTEQRALLSKAYMEMKMNDTTNTLFLSIRYPFSSKEEFRLLQQSLQQWGSPSPYKYLSSQMPDETKSMLQILSYVNNSQFSFDLSSGAIERSFQGTDSTIVVFPGSQHEDKDNEEAAIMAALFGNNLSQVNMYTVLELPVPASKVVTSREYTISSDKKKIKITHLNDLKVLKPSYFTYKVLF